MDITIKYNGPIVDEVRNGWPITNEMRHVGSYIDSPVYVNGHVCGVQVGEVAAEEKAYGRSVYATNNHHWGRLAGLLPMASASVKIAVFERAVLAARKAAETEGENEGYTFPMPDDYQEKLYWEQMAPHFEEFGFEVSLGEE